MKYIPADKLIAEIRIIQQSLEHRDVRFNQVKKIRTECMIEFCKRIFDVIASLKQEQPEGCCSEKPNNLLSNLDEAAKEYNRNYIPYDQCDSRDIRCSFKAGAEWMAGQGVAKEAVIGMATEEISINVSQQTLNELDLCPGDKVVVQIRKIL